MSCLNTSDILPGSTLDQQPNYCCSAAAPAGHRHSPKYLAFLSWACQGWGLILGEPCLSLAEVAIVCLTRSDLTISKSWTRAACHLQSTSWSLLPGWKENARRMQEFSATFSLFLDTLSKRGEIFEAVTKIIKGNQCRKKQSTWKSSAEAQVVTWCQRGILFREKAN